MIKEQQAVTFIITLVINFITVYSYLNNKDVSSNTRITILEESVKHLTTETKKIDKQNQILIDLTKEVALLTEKIQNIDEKLGEKLYDKQNL